MASTGGSLSLSRLAAISVVYLALVVLNDQSARFASHRGEGLDSHMAPTSAVQPPHQQQQHHVHISLPDLGHRHLPIIALHLPDYISIFILVLTIALVAAHPQRLEMTGYFLMVHSALLAMRALCIMATVLPSPFLSCRRPTFSEEYEGIVPFHCNETIFSGHTTLNLLCALFWSISRVPFLGKALMWVCAVTGSISMIASRQHYTIDVLIASFLTPLVFNIWRPQIALLFLSSNAKTALHVGKPD
jgi:hypothetical protein